LSATPTLASFRRIVVKVGSSLLVDQTAGLLKHEWLEALVDDLAELHRREGISGVDEKKSRK
jgi:glutamate 5-kinase